MIRSSSGVMHDAPSDTSTQGHRMHTSNLQRTPASCHQASRPRCRSRPNTAAHTPASPGSLSMCGRGCRSWGGTGDESQPAHAGVTSECRLSPAPPSRTCQHGQHAPGSLGGGAQQLQPAPRWGPDVLHQPPQEPAPHPAIRGTAWRSIRAAGVTVRDLWMSSSHQLQHELLRVGCREAE